MEKDKNKIGLKMGSMNTAVAARDGEQIKTQSMKTCVRIPKKFITQPNGHGWIVGDEAAKFNNAIYPLNLGAIVKDSGIIYAKAILGALDLPSGAQMVLAAPATKITEGKERLIQAVKQVCEPADLWYFNEGLCSAAHILQDPNMILESTFFSINLGSSTTEFGCFSEGDIVHLSAHSDICGNKTDSNIRNVIMNKVGDAVLTLKDAKDIKEQASLTNIKTFDLKPLTTDGYDEVEVSTEVTEPIMGYCNAVAEMVKKEIIYNIKPEIRQDALRMPIIVSGGMANIEGLPEYLISCLNTTMRANYDLRYPTGKDSHIAPAIGGLLLAEAVAAETVETESR